MIDIEHLRSNPQIYKNLILSGRGDSSKANIDLWISLDEQRRGLIKSTEDKKFKLICARHASYEQDKKVDMVFRKYANGMISYEILGPLSQKPFGEKLDKYGRKRPEIIKWVDPRTGEQVIRTASGMLTPIGTRLKAFMSKQKVNKTDAWQAWIDREFIIMDGSTNMIDNPWGN